MKKHLTQTACCLPGISLEFKPVLLYAGLFLLTSFYVLSQAVDIYMFHFMVDIYLARIAMAVMAIGIALILGREFLLYIFRLKDLLCILVAWSIYLVVNAFLGASPTASGKLLVRFVGAWIIALEIGILIHVRGRNARQPIGAALLFTLLLIILAMHLEASDSPFFRQLLAGLRNYPDYFGSRAQALYVNPNILGMVLALHAAAAIWYSLHPVRSLIIIPLIWFTAFFAILQSGSTGAFIGLTMVGAGALFAYRKSPWEVPLHYRRWLNLALPLLVGISIIALSLVVKAKFDRRSIRSMDYDYVSWGWSLVDDDLPGGRVARVYDDDRQSNVVEVSADGLPKHFIYEFPPGSGGQNSSRHTIEWSMNFSRPFVITIFVNTGVGRDAILYTPSDMFIEPIYDSGLAFEVGSDIADGKWHTVTRDLQADLQKGAPGAEILGVSALMVWGDGKLDDIKLGTHFHEDFESRTKNILDNFERVLNHVDKGRMQVWKRAYNYWENKPLTGIGLGSFQYMPNETLHHAHSFIFDILVEQGLLGIVLLVLFIWMLTRRMKSWTGFTLLGCVLFSQLFDDLSPIMAFPVYVSLILGYCFGEVLEAKQA